MNCHAINHWTKWNLLQIPNLKLAITFFSLNFLHNIVDKLYTFLVPVILLLNTAHRSKLHGKFFRAP